MRKMHPLDPSRSSYSKFQHLLDTFKLHDLKDITPQQYHLLQDRLSRFRDGNFKAKFRQENLPRGVHGITRIRRGDVKSIGVNVNDPEKRQEISTVHEYLHAIYHPNQPDHQQLHTAAGLFVGMNPGRKGDTLFDENLLDADERTALMDIIQDEEGDVESYDEYWKNPFAGIGRKLFGSKFGRKRVRAGGVAVPQKRIIPPTESMFVTQKGWVMQLLKRAYEMQSFVVPIAGVLGAYPKHQMSGFKAASFNAFMQEMMSSLDARAYRSTPAHDQKIAAAGVDTNPALVNASSIGLIIRISSVPVDSDYRNVEIAHFSQLAALTQDYVIMRQPKTVYSEYLAIQVENNMGKGVCIAQDDCAVKVLDGKIKAGDAISIRPINKRDLEM